jgi:hypothetical protein
MNNQSSIPRFKLKAAPMVVGAVLVGAGGLMGIAGAIVGGHAMLAATRRWFRSMAVEPMQDMRPSWAAQTQAAAKAGMPAMHGNGTPAHSGHL